MKKMRAWVRGQKAGGTTTFVATEVNVCIVEILIAFA